MKARKILASLLAAGCLSVACFAEAATVALLPLIDKSNFEDHESANATFMAAAISTINTTEGFTLVDSESFAGVLDKNLEPGKLPNEQALKNIAAQSGVDVIIATQLDVLDTSYRSNMNGNFLKVDVRGFCVSYNALTGKYKKGRIFDDTERDSNIYARSSMELEYWRDAVRHEINAALGNKKLKLERPTMGW